MCGLSVTKSGGSQLALRLCSAWIDREVDTCLKGALGFQNAEQRYAIILIKMPP